MVTTPVRADTFGAYNSAMRASSGSSTEERRIEPGLPVIGVCHLRNDVVQCHRMSERLFRRERSAARGVYENRHRSGA